jgi:hypothetical protein
MLFNVVDEICCKGSANGVEWRAEMLQLFIKM